MYARQVEGYPEPLTFGVSGKLIMNVLVMYDRETNSLWSQILGKAVQGELTGTALVALPALQTTWGQWKELHPDTVALDKGYAGSYDGYSGYYRSGQAGVLGETRQDDRLPRKTIGLGLVLDGQPAYYPFDYLAKEPVVNDQVGDRSLLVVFRPEVQTATAFERSLASQVLTFSQADDEAEGFILVDAETGSKWSAWTGVAFDGPLAGQALRRLPATTSFWFGWKDWHPDTYVYGLESG